MAFTPSCGVTSPVALLALNSQLQKPSIKASHQINIGK
jgi:hypothetical protein